MRGAGFVDGENVRIEARFGEGKTEPLAGFAEELVRLKVDVLVANSRPAIEAARAVTSDIPIVAVDLESDPIASGYVASLAAPGGNITGLFLDAPALTGKWLQQIRDVVPDLRQLAALWDANTGEYQLRALMAAAQPASVDVQVIAFRGADAIEAALDRGLSERPQALIALGSPVTNMRSARIAAVATKHRMPSISIYRSLPENGGLMSYGPVLDVWFLQVGRYVASVLRGARTSDLPVYRPNLYEVVLNVKTAGEMGLKFPAHLLAQADEVIE
jgi:putative ABC transport system substrate-binding protein